MKHNIHIFDSANKTANAVAELIYKATVEKNKLGEYYNVALSGGTTPRELFVIMAQDYKELIPWESLRLFWVDERCVGPTDGESNYGMTYHALLSHELVLSENIFRMKGEEIPAVEAERYQKVLITELPARNGFPVFDLILLGIGNDGHTASIFPDNLAMLDSDLLVAVATHPESGQKRITLTAKTINNAEQVVFVVTGQSKSTIVAEILGGAEKAKLYPSSYIQTTQGSVDFYMDKSAAAKL